MAVKFSVLVYIKWPPTSTKGSLLTIKTPPTSLNLHNYLYFILTLTFRFGLKDILPDFRLDSGPDPFSGLLFSSSALISAILLRPRFCFLIGWDISIGSVEGPGSPSSAGLFSDEGFIGLKWEQQGLKRSRGPEDI